MPAAIAPFLMFQKRDCEKAIRFYVELFEGAELGAITHWPAGTPGPEGGVMASSFRVAGVEIRANDSPPVHDFDFTPSLSLFVDCADEAELDAAYAALAEGGTELMPLGDYGFSRKFGWVNDRFGVSWQLNLPAEA